MNHLTKTSKIIKETRIFSISSIYIIYSPNLLALSSQISKIDDYIERKKNYNSDRKINDKGKVILNPDTS